MTTTIIETSMAYYGDRRQTVTHKRLSCPHILTRPCPSVNHTSYTETGKTMMQPNNSGSRMRMLRTAGCACLHRQREGRRGLSRETATLRGDRSPPPRVMASDGTRRTAVCRASTRRSRPSAARPCCYIPIYVTVL